MESIIIYTLLAIVLICVCYLFNRELKYEKLKYLTNKQKELDTDKVVINEKNRSIAKQIAQFYSYRG